MPGSVAVRDPAAVVAAARNPLTAAADMVLESTDGPAGQRRAIVCPTAPASLDAVLVVVAYCCSLSCDYSYMITPFLLGGCFCCCCLHSCPVASCCCSPCSDPHTCAAAALQAAIHTCAAIAAKVVCLAAAAAYAAVVRFPMGKVYPVRLLSSYGRCSDSEISLS